MSFTRQRARGVIHSAVYRVVRQLQPMSLQQFYSTKVEDTVPSGPSPTGWRGFWWVSIADEIQNGAMAYKTYILDFDGQWLKQNKNRTWNQVLDYIGPRRQRI